MNIVKSQIESAFLFKICALSGSRTIRDCIQPALDDLKYKTRNLEKISSYTLLKIKKTEIIYSFDIQGGEPELTPLTTVGGSVPIPHPVDDLVFQTIR